MEWKQSADGLSIVEADADDPKPGDGAALESGGQITVVGGDDDSPAARSRRGLDAGTSGQATVEVEAGDGYDPDANIDDVKAWAGDDPARRARALEAETAGKNRSTLVAWLTPADGD